MKRAKALGDFLVVGVHDDSTVNQIKGNNYPILTLHERVLSVLACRYVDEVIIGAPYTVTKDVLERDVPVFMVVHGTSNSECDVDGKDPYALPKYLNIYKEIETPFSSMSTMGVIERIINNRQVYEERNKKKMLKAAQEEKMLLNEKLSK